MSNSWGNFALNDGAGLFYMGTSQAAPDWNATYRPGPDLTADSVLGVSLKNGSIIWEDKVAAKDVNDQDCNLNVHPGRCQRHPDDTKGMQGRGRHRHQRAQRSAALDPRHDDA